MGVDVGQDHGVVDLDPSDFGGVLAQQAPASDIASQCVEGPKPSAPEKNRGSGLPTPAGGDDVAAGAVGLDLTAQQRGFEERLIARREQDTGGTGGYGAEPGANRSALAFRPAGVGDHQQVEIRERALDLARGVADHHHERREIRRLQHLDGPPDQWYTTDGAQRLRDRPGEPATATRCEHDSGDGCFTRAHRPTLPKRSRRNSAIEYAALEVFMKLRPTLASALLLGVLAAPAALALDVVYVVRHAEKEAPWPKGYEVYQPLSDIGRARAQSLAESLSDAEIAGVYTSETTRTFSTGVPVALATGATIEASRATIDVDALPGFVASLRERHAEDRAVLIVGHSNTVSRVLDALGARDDCHVRLGIGGDGFVEGYEGLWTADLTKPGCAGIERHVHVVPGTSAAAETSEPSAEHP